MKRLYTLWTILMLSFVPMMGQTIAGSQVEIAKQSVSISDNNMIIARRLDKYRCNRLFFIFCPPPITYTK